MGFWVSPDFKVISAGVAIFLFGMLSLEEGFRAFTGGALERLLRGDLDWVVMTALAKDPARRYGSPNELAADVGRHLAHQPVMAGPPTRATAEITVCFRPERRPSSRAASSSSTGFSRTWPSSTAS